jgi:hypothetical protein
MNSTRKIYKLSFINLCGWIPIEFMDKIKLYTIIHGWNWIHLKTLWMFIQLFHSLTRKNSLYLGHFSFIKINILVVGYDSYMDFIQSMGLVLSIKIHFIHGDRLFRVMFYPSTHILVCQSIQWFLQLVACKMNTIKMKQLKVFCAFETCIKQIHYTNTCL